MKILGHYKHAWPVQRGGSEVAAHRMLRWLQDQGHEVTVAVTAQRAIPIDGINYVEALKRRDVDALWQDADVVITHQSATGETVPLGQKYGIPVFHWAHNNVWFPKFGELLDPERDRIIWNSFALQGLATSMQWVGDSRIVHPPVFPNEYTVSDGDAILQVNMSRLKGGEIFWQLAQDNTDTPFLGVVGGWGNQIDKRGVEHHWRHSVQPLLAGARANVTITATTQNMAGEVYPRAKAIIIPTQRVSAEQIGESWGLVAAEAICCGVVPIATSSPGMEELLDGCGISIADPYDIEEWQAAIDVVNDETQYALLRRGVMDRKDALYPDAELSMLEAWLEESIPPPPVELP